MFFPQMCLIYFSHVYFPSFGFGHLDKEMSDIAHVLIGVTQTGMLCTIFYSFMHCLLIGSLLSHGALP